jgi:AcrR family transcriptional regulator
VPRRSERGTGVVLAAGSSLLEKTTRVWKFPLSMGMIYGVCLLGAPCSTGAELSVSAGTAQRIIGRDVIPGPIAARRRVAEVGVVRRRTLRKVDSRTRLIVAILELLETRDADFLTVDVIVRAAQLSRTTFYRLFPDREGALHAAADRMLSDVLAALPRLDAPLGDAEPERLRDWVAGLLDELTRCSRAWRAGDERWRRLVLADLENYVARLREARLVRCDAPHTIAAGVVYVLDGVLAHARHASRESLDAASRATVAEVAERLVFGA